MDDLGRLTECSDCGASIRVATGYGGGPAVIDPDPIPDDELVGAEDELVGVVIGHRGVLHAVQRADVAGRGLALYRFHHDTCRRNRGVPDDPAELRAYLGLTE